MVEWKTVSASDWTDSESITDPSQAYFLITDLTPNQLYMVRVSATNADTANGATSTVGQDAIAAPMAVTVDPEPPAERPALKAPLMATDSSTAGAAVRVELAIQAKERLDLDDNIVVDFGSFGVPDSIDESRVDLRVWGRAGNDGEARMPYEGHPTDVTVSGSKVTLVLGQLSNANATPKSVSRVMMDDEVNITFRQSAGITNPTSAKDNQGNYTIGVDADSDMGRMTDDDGDYLDRNEGSVVRKVTVSPKSGSRGDEITVSGTGFGTGTATVNLGSTTLSRNVAIEDGSFEVTLTVGDSFSGGDNTINAIDGAGNEADKSNAAVFELTTNIEASPSEVALAGTVTIKVSDWSKGMVSAVNFGGDVITDLTDNTTGSANKGEFKFTVPTDARIGVNKVTLLDDSKPRESLGSVNVTVKALELGISPSSVVPGQQVTITGSSFGDSQLVTSVTFGGEPVASSELTTDTKSTSSGRIAITVTVPVSVGDGEAKVILEAANGKRGEGTVTVAKPAISLNPATSVPGSVISVIGSGFPSRAWVQVRYDGNIRIVEQADSSGAFSIRLTVPANAGVGDDNPVVVEAQADTDINASADHSTPGSAITLPEEAQVGSLMTVSGTNFAVFSTLSVRLGTHTVTPTPVPETDKNGAFTVQVRVPRIAAGSHTVTVTDGSTDANSATETFNVTTTAVVSTPEEVFGVLGDKLTVVWRYDNATATWSSYSPGAPDELNDLTGVSRGDIVWIQVTEDVEFQGQTLYLGTTGWNLITLE